MRIVSYEGRLHSYPDDTPDEVIDKDLVELYKPASTEQVIKAIPGEAYRQFAELGQGVAQAFGDVTGQPTDAALASKEIEAERTAEVPRNMSLLQEGLFSGGTSALTNAPIAVAGALAAPAASAAVGVPAATKFLLGVGTTAMGAMTGFQKYGETRDAGFSPERSSLHGLFHGLVEKYTEYLPLREFTKGGTLTKMLGNWTIREIPGEQIATLLQDLNDAASTKPDMTLGDFLHNQAVTTISTAVAGPLQGATVGATIKAMSPFIKPEQLTPEQSATLVPALIEAQRQAGITPIVDPNATAQQALQTAMMQVSQRPDVDVNALAAKTVDMYPIPASETGDFVRYYSVVPAGATSQNGGLPQLVRWTNNLDTLQQWVNEAGRNVDIAYMNQYGPDTLKRQNEPEYVTARTALDIGTNDIVWLSGSIGMDNRWYVFRGEPLSGGFSLKAPSGLTSPQDQITQGGSNVSGLPRDARNDANDIVVSSSAHGAVNQGVSTASTTETPQAYKEKTSGGPPGDVWVPKKESVPAAEIKVTNAPKSLAFETTGSGMLYAFAQMYYGDRANAVQRGKTQGWLAQTFGVEFGEVPQLAAWYSAMVNRVVETMPALTEEHFAPNVSLYRSQTVGETEVEKQHRVFAESVPVGKVVIATGVQESDYVKEMQKYLQAWTTMFAPGTKLVIAGVAIPGYTNRFGAGWVTIGAPTSVSSRLARLLSTAHEFGHHLVRSFLTAPENVVLETKLRVEWELLRAKMDSGQYTAEQFISTWMAPQKVFQRQALLDKYGVQPGDPYQGLVAAIDAAHFDGYTLSFDEYAAEQFVRYMTSREVLTFSDASRYTSKSWREKLQEFFDKVVAKLTAQPDFTAFVNQLRSNPSEVTQASEVQASIGWSMLDIVDKEVGLTTLVLSRLPVKERLLKETIRQEMKRSDVRQQEKVLLDTVLQTFDGDFVNRSLFFDRVRQALIPLTTKDTSSYGTYGLTRIDVDVTRLIRIDPNESARTTVYVLPFPVSEANHFTEPNYFGHARSFDLWAENGLEKVRSVVELQSDLLQRDTQKMQGTEELQQVVDVARRNLGQVEDQIVAFRLDPYKQAPGFDSWSAYAVSIYEALGVFSISRNLNYDEMYRRLVAQGDIVPVETYPNLTKTLSPNAVNQISDALEFHRDQVSQYVLDVEISLRRAQEMAALPIKLSTLPKSWWEYMLRAETIRAAQQGIDIMRMATAETVALVEGWSRQNNYNLVVVGQHQWGWEDSNYTIVGETYGSSEEARKHKPPDFYGSYQGLFNRYKTEISKFVQREFSAKEVTDSTNHTWWEWPLDAKLATLPIQYYDLETTLGGDMEGAEEVGNAAGLPVDVPELSKAYTRFQGFFTNGLQLTQTAKMLPNVGPLQLYRRLMEAMANMKTSLTSEPNSRIGQWYDLSKKDSLGVMDMMRTEGGEGTHWTNVVHTTETTVDGTHDVYFHQITERVRSEATMRGLSEDAVKLYMNVKNDYLFTLQTLEQTLTKSIERHFADNPIVMQTRLAVMRQQFEQFRNKPYYHDVRQGQWLVLVRAKAATVVNGTSIKAGEVVYRSHHRNRFSQKLAYSDAAKQYGHDFAVSMDYMSDATFAVRGLPKKFVEALPELLQFSPTQLEKFEQLYFDLTKEGAYLKLLAQGKKRVPGAELDLRIGYADYMWRTSNLIAKLAYARQLSGQLYQMNKIAERVSKQGGDVRNYRRLAEYMQKNYDYTMSPQHEWEQVRAFVSLWYLWASPKTAAMNATTVATTTYPHIAAALAEKYGIGKGDALAVKEVLQAIKDTAMYWKDPSKLAEGNEALALIDRLRRDGVINQSFAAELAAVTDGLAIERIMPTYAFMKDSGMRDRVRKMSWKLLHMGMLPFRVTEEFNRRVTALAAYRAAKLLGKPGIMGNEFGEGTAYQFARDAVTTTQNEYSPWNRAPFIRGKKSIALIFFSFTQNMTFFMFGGDKGWWRAMMVMAAMAGLTGLPGAENLFDMLNWLGRKVFDEPVDLRLEARELAQEIGLNPDYVMHGATHSMFGLGWDVSTSVGLGRIIPGTDAVFGQGDFNQRFVQAAGEIGGPFFNMSISVLQALTDDNPNALLRWDRALPPALRNIERTYNAAMSGEWQDRQGQALVDETNGLELLGQLGGFSPTSKTKVQERLHEQREIAQYYVLRRSNLMAMYFQAKMSKDFDAISDAKDAIRRYNESVPNHQLRITGQELAQSYAARLKTKKEVEQGVSPAKRYRLTYERVAGAFAQE